MELPGHPLSFFLLYIEQMRLEPLYVFLGAPGMGSDQTLSIILQRMVIEICPGESERRISHILSDSIPGNLQ
jgi:hypothetical protein